MSAILSFAVQPRLALVPLAEPRARPLCPCSYCSRPRHHEPDPDTETHRRRRLGVGWLGAREPHEPSRWLEFRPREDRSSRRPSRASFEPREIERVAEPVPFDRAEAFDALQKRPVRRHVLWAAGGRMDWLHEVLLEIEYPPADIEQPSDLAVRIDRAVWRFEKRLMSQVRSLSLPQTFLSLREK